MPSLIGTDLSNWRTHPQKLMGYCYILVPTRVVQRRINQATFSYPTARLEFDNPDGDTGDTADVQVNQIIKFSDSSGTFKGWGRVHYPITGTPMYIAPVGQGMTNFADNDIIEIFNEYHPWSLVPFISTAGTLFKDYNVAYSDQGSKMPPIANCAITVDSLFVAGDPAVITVAFNAGGSFHTADGASIASDGYAWDLGDGTRTVGGANDAQITATFPAGFRWVKLTVTDSNSKSSVKYIPIPACERTGANAPFRCEMSRRGGTVQNGWEASFKLLDADVSTIPENALVIYFEEEWFGTSTVPVTSNCIKFMGWTVDETVTIEPFWSDMVVNAVGPLGILRLLPAFPQTVEGNATPDTWAEVKTLNWGRMVAYLLLWHSTILELVNFEVPTMFYVYPVVRLDSELGTLYDQIAFLARAVWGRFTADQRGNLYIRQNPQLMDASNRNAVASIVTLVDSDLAERIELSKPHQDAFAWVRGAAIIANATAVSAVAGVSPGTTPGYYGGFEDLNNLLVASQVEFNNYLGNYYAWKNSIYNGARTWNRLDMRLKHRGDVIDPGWQEWIKLTLSGSTNKRGASFSNTRCVVNSVEVTTDYRRGVSSERITAEQETAGPAGVTEVVPTDGINDIPIPEWTDPVVIDPVENSSPIDLADTLVYGCDTSTVRRALTFTSGDPGWETIFTAGSGETIHDFRLHKNDPKNQAQVVVAHTTPEVRIYGTTTLQDTVPTWTLLRTIATQAQWMHLTGVHMFEDFWFLLVSNGDGSKALDLYSTVDNWATLRAAAAAGRWESDSSAASAGLAFSSHAATNASGYVWVSYISGGGVVKIRESSDFGQTFADRTTFDGAYNFQRISTLEAPWQATPADTILYAMTDDYTFKSVDRFGTVSEVQTDGIGRAVHRKRCMMAHVDNSDLMAAVFSAAGGDELRVSDDGGTTWVVQSSVAVDALNNIGGWPYDYNVIFVSGDGGLYFSEDRGLTWVDKAWAGWSGGIWVEPLWLA